MRTMALRTVTTPFHTLLRSVGNPWSSLGLRNRLVAIFGLSALTILALLSWLYLSTLVSAINLQYQEKAMAIWQVFEASHNSAQEIRGPLIQEHLASLMQGNREVHRLTVYAPVGDRVMRVASSDPDELWRPISSEESEEVDAVLRGQVVWHEFESGDEPLAELVAPLRVDGQPVGAIAVYFRLDGRNALARVQIATFVFFGVGAVLLLLAVLFWELNRLLIRPLDALERHARAVARGQLHYRTGIRRTDEIGRLSEAYDDMSDALQQREDENAQLRRELEQRYKWAEERAITDSITELYNHRYFRERLDEELERARRYGRPLSLLFCDIDHFKAINDVHGHQFGDLVLREIADRLRQALRDVDICARYGGEEFAILLPETDEQGAWVVAERLRHGVASASFGNAMAIPVTISIGTAQYPDDARTAEEIVRCADRAMYQAKHLGRNQVCRYAQGADVMTRAESSWIEQIYLNAVHSLAAAVDARDHYTHGHSESVARYATAIAHHLGQPAQELINVRIGALLHDIGKIGVPDKVLGKPGPLSDDEWAKMREHPALGRTIVQHIASLHSVLPLIAHHHERYDGSGYPNRLAATDIPLGARIIAVADAYHAMVSDRPYRRGLSPAAAQEELRRGTGTQFDPQVVTAFLKVLEQGIALHEGDALLAQAIASWTTGLSRAEGKSAS